MDAATQSLTTTAALLGLLADPTRMRLLALLGAHELSVAELTRITGVPQSRVSTHLGKLKDAGFVRDRRVGTSIFYRVDEARTPQAARAAWQTIAASLDDAMLIDDRERCAETLRARTDESEWPDAVAGRMEHHYSPGRTWEATARAFVGLVQLGDVLDLGSGDGVIAQLLSPRARTYTCIDRSAKVIEAARARLRSSPNVELLCGDMHALPLPDQSFDQVLSFSVLTYAEDPRAVMSESLRVLRPGGTLILVTLDEHRHGEISSAYQHVNAGFSPGDLHALLEDAGFVVDRCDVTAREKRKPYFDVVCAFAHRPERSASSRARSSRPRDSARRVPHART
ncbi:MAG: metalloregulator ArsR/SmtB family transcription factor [Deltaproteobacteria bacterium]|nr:metalloregulator ArsR/SmtB family transcription factor [Nannocystaceae bacterium]